jgi:hypothetical protein
MAQRRGSVGREVRLGGYAVMIDVVGDVDAALGLDPLVCVGETRIGADNGDDALRGGLNLAGFLEEKVENGAKIFATPGVEASGVGVAIDGRPVEFAARAEIAVDALRAVPTDEKIFDGFAVRVIADEAFAGVAVEIRVIAERGLRRFGFSGGGAGAFGRW